MAVWAIAAAVPRDEPAPPPAENSESDRASEDTGVTEAVVTLTTGRELEGVLVSDTPESVVLRINGIETTLPRWRVTRVRVLPPVEERYRTMRASVEDADIRARLSLAEWLRNRQAYRLALEELDGILEIEPGNPDARTLHTWLRNHLDMASRTRPARREVRTPAASSIPVLTPEQINRIRVYELDLNHPTRIVVPDDVMRELMVRFPETFPVSLEEREAMLKLDAVDKMRILFDRKARDLYDSVRVLEDPPAMASFKTRIHGAGGWIINACASNRCHGGSEAGRLQLLSQRPNSDETAYTNFLILDRFRLADGTPLINYDEPARSPLLHMAMSRRASLYPHPAIDPREFGQDWRFVFRTTNDRRFIETAEWIASLYTPRTDYGITYPPGSGEADGRTDGQGDPGGSTDTENPDKDRPEPFGP